MQLLTEMPWLQVELEIPTTTGRKVRVDMIDVRIEELISAGLIPRDKYALSWYAQIPDTNVFLTSGGELISDPSVVVGDDPENPQAKPLPEEWWQFAYGSYKERNVKASINPRTEQGEQSQEELDRMLPTVQKLAI